MSLLATLLFAATLTRSMERVTTMDPIMARSLYESCAMQLVYEPVLDVDYCARPYKLTAGYCELPSVSEDKLTYTFKTRKGPAADVVRSLERLRDPKLLSPNAWMMRDVETIRALDEKTVEIRLKKPVRYFPWLMAMTGASVMGPNGEGTGPYKLTNWWRNHEMVFTRKEPVEGGFDEVRYLVVDDPSTQWLMFLKGELDILREVPRDNWDAVVDANGQLSAALAEKGIQLYSKPTLEVMHIGINMRDPVVGTNKKLRQALNAAFDSAAWQKFYGNRILPSDGPVPPGVEGRLETPFAYRFNLEKAKKLLAEAGYPNGIDPQTGRRLVLTLALGRANQDARESGELMVAFFERIGIKLELQFYTWDAFLSAVNEGRVQLYRMGWVGDYPDAQNFLQLFYSANRSPGVNHMNYESPEYDAAYEAGDYTRCQEIVREDCPWIFTHFNKMNSLVQGRVKNFVPSDFAEGCEQFYRVGQEGSQK